MTDHRFSIRNKNTVTVCFFSICASRALLNHDFQLHMIISFQMQQEIFYLMLDKCNDFLRDSVFDIFNTVSMPPGVKFDFLNVFFSTSCALSRFQHFHSAELVFFRFGFGNKAFLRKTNTRQCINQNLSLAKREKIWRKVGNFRPIHQKREIFDWYAVLHALPCYM